MTNLVLLEQQDRIATITINRAEVRNALNQETIKQLIRAFKSCSKNKHLRAIILRGAGSDAFCAGADLSELQNAANKKAREHFFTSLSDLIQIMHNSSAVIIALVHGFALAGGCGIAAAADIVLASDQAVFGLPELHIGLVPMVVMPAVQRAVGRRALQELVLTAERINADKAKEIGLVTQVLAKNTLEKSAYELAEKISHLAPAALKAAKELIFEVDEIDYKKLLKTAPKKIATLSLGKEAQEGISAFLEKRKPSWH